MTATKTTLDEMTRHGCAMPDCDHKDHDTLYLHGRCHLRGRIEVSYRHGSGMLRVGCMECGKIIAWVKVAG